MSLSPLVSFKSRFVTYLLNFPRIFTKCKINNTAARHMISGTPCEFPGYCHDVIEDFTLLVCYTVYVGSLPAYTV